MPLGVAKLTSLAKAAIAAPPTGGASFTAFSQLNGDSIYSATYQGLAYCGENSSGHPVFVSAYATTNRLTQYAQMFSVDPADGSITTGTKYTLASVASGNLLVGPSVTTERDGANIRQDLSANDFIYFGWRLYPAHKVRARCASYDLNNLTMSLGTEETFSDTFTARGQVAVSWTGSDVAVMSRGGNNNNFVLQANMARTSGTSLALTTSINSGVSWGGWGFATVLGFKNDRSVVTGVGNNNDRVQFAAYRKNSGSLVHYTQQIQEQNETNTRNISAYFNATDSLINLRYETQQTPANTQIEGVIINWQSGTTAPTITRTNQIEWYSTAVSRLMAINGTSDGEAYLGRRDQANLNDDIVFCKVTLSGTTISKSTDKTISVPANTRLGESHHNSNRMVSLSNGDEMWVTFFENTLASARGDIMVVMNPDGL